jgi:hypothetical protein
VLCELCTLSPSQGEPCIEPSQVWDRAASGVKEAHSLQLSVSAPWGIKKVFGAATGGRVGL